MVVIIIEYSGFASCEIECDYSGIPFNSRVQISGEICWNVGEMIMNEVMARVSKLCFLLTCCHEYTGFEFWWKL